MKRIPFTTEAFPLYLAPMAGVTDKVFRQICKRFGADVVVTEFVSAEGVFRRNGRTREYLEFDHIERPLGVQLFGADPAHMAEAARQVVDWVRPDFIDLNFGCPVNKVVSRNGGSALLKDCPTLARVAEAVVRAIAPLPVTAKIRIGWDADSINAVGVARILADCGVAALAVHGRTRAQGYAGEADWRVIGEVAESIALPVIGNGDVTRAQDVARRKVQTKISGVMIGRAAMSAPWIFDQIKVYLRSGEISPPPSPEERWDIIVEHCRAQVENWGAEEPAMRAMRARLMAYSRYMPQAKALREKLQHVCAVADVERIAREQLERSSDVEDGNDRRAPLHSAASLLHLGNNVHCSGGL